MATYLLTWNPNEWPWSDLNESSRKVKSGKTVTIQWSCGNTKKIKAGDRIFMLIQGQGVDPKGICASGTVIQGSFGGDNWKENPAQMIKFEFDTLLDPRVDQLLPRHLLDEPRFSGVKWSTQRSGITIADVVASELEKTWMKFSNSNNLSKVDDLREVQTGLENSGYFDAENFEDARSKIERSIVQRRGQPKFRRQLLSAYGGRCAITDCDAEAALEAAHIMPYRGEHSNNPANGLILRADIHTLFDLHLLSIHPDTHKVVLSHELTASSYQHSCGDRQLRLPHEKALPDQAALKNHYEMFLNKHKKTH
jgi:hypothetical protein